MISFLVFTVTASHFSHAQTVVDAAKTWAISITYWGIILSCYTVCACTRASLLSDSEPGALKCLCFEELLFWFGSLCPCLYIRWSLNGIMMIIINSGENQWRNWYFKSTDINKRHQRDKCCFNVCLLVGKQAGVPVIRLTRGEQEKKKEKQHQLSLLPETVLCSKSTPERICGSLMEWKY